MEPNIKGLKLEREEILDGLLKIIDVWDGSNEKGLEIIEATDSSLDRVKMINNLLETHESSSSFDASYEEKVRQVQEKYGAFIEELQIEKDKLFELIKEIKLKEKIKNSYILTKNESVFIDKDL